jgi:hypothetical protein
LMKNTNYEAVFFFCAPLLLAVSWPKYSQHSPRNVVCSFHVFSFQSRK